METTINLTGIIVTLLALLFNALLVWLGKSVAPGVKEWLAARTTAQQRETLWNVTLQLVKGAQQLYDEGLIQGPRLQHVIDGLKERGFTVDLDAIKAAVLDLNRNFADFAHEIIVGVKDEATHDGIVEENWEAKA